MSYHSDFSASTEVMIDDIDEEEGLSCFHETNLNDYFGRNNWNFSEKDQCFCTKISKLEFELLFPIRLPVDLASMVEISFRISILYGNTDELQICYGYLEYFNEVHFTPETNLVTKELFDALLFYSE